MAHPFEEAQMPSPSRDPTVFPLSEIQARRKRAGGLYLEFLRVPAMSVGYYALHAGGVDPQTPHTEDEVYFVIRGRAAITIAGRDHPVEPGETIFVAKGVDHRFHSVTEPLELLVVFAPQESLDSPPPPRRRP
jgi:mannose-6-phosphate isomerase-like protein (cupin superfamily)